MECADSSTLSLQASGLLSLSTWMSRLGPNRNAHRMSQKSNIQIQGIPTNRAQYCVQRRNRSLWKKQGLCTWAAQKVLLRCVWWTESPQHPRLLGVQMWAKQGRLASEFTPRPTLDPKVISEEQTYTSCNCAVLWYLARVVLLSLN
jgi:hypothetical protein